MRKDAIEAKKTANLQNKQKNNIKLYVFSMLVLMLMLTGTYYVECNKVKHLDSDIKQLKEEIEAEKSKTKSLNDMIQNRDSNEFIEKMAREQLGYVKPNEIIYVDKDK